MYPMDSQQFNDFSIASDLSADKRYIIRQLSDMFYGISLTIIRGICEECLWNVDLCIDKLITTDGDSGRGQGKAMSTTATAGSSFSSVAQNASGAVPKAVSHTVVQSKQSVQELPAAYVGVYDAISSGYKILILMRGCPGSGKSSLAKLIAKSLMPGMDWKEFVISADDYHWDSLGRYKFSIERLDDAHKYCQARAREKAALGWSPIIIDNTNIKLFEMMPYVQAAVQNGYLVEMMEPVTPWRWSVGKLAVKNVHNVAKHTIQRMLDSYEIGTTNDVISLLKETKYTVSLPQLRTFPPPPIVQPQPQPQQQQPAASTETHSTNIKNEMEATPNCTTIEQMMQIEKSFANTSNDWTSYEAPAEVKQSLIPKSPRPNNKNKQQAQQSHDTMQRESDENVQQNGPAYDQGTINFWGIPFTPTQANKQYADDEKPEQLFPAVPTVWQAYEKEATNFWGVPVTTASTNIEPMNTDQNESCGLLQLLKEGVKSINVPNKEKSSENDVQSSSTVFERHRVDCENENQSFIALRQIYPNKPVAELWDLFVKCNGSIDWAVDILLKDDDSVGYEMDLIENCDNYDCGCDNPMKDHPSVINIPLPDVNVKPQRAKAGRNRARPSAEILEVKEAVEKSIVLGDEHYSSHVKKIRNKRNAIEEPSNGKTFIDIQVQTEGDENDNISEEGADASEVLEINLGEDLIGQLTEIFKLETPTLTIPEKYITNVFMPKSLAREIYILWMESLYNQIEEQRQSTLKEDEDFARLLKHPKYENCKQPPENIKELLDMEFAWMIYKTDQDELRTASTQHQHPNDLASHLTRMKLCEIFPNIPRETLLDILAAHNNKFSDTVEVLKSSIQPATIDHQVSAKVLIEKARDENEKLNKEVEQHQQEQKFTNTSHSSSFKQLHSTSQPDEAIPRKRSISPDEAKRLALKEFEETRNYAAHHCQLRAECYQKAKEAIQRGNSGVAVYYSQIANLHKKKIDIYNHRAANCIMEVHDLTQNNPDFIDLHYLHVIEAVACLDIFIDKHIAKLRSIFRSFKYVFIITGRGLHSTGGVSTIKTKVKSRLKERNLKWSEVNPGLLKVKIFSASKYAKNL